MRLIFLVAAIAAAVLTSSIAGAGQAEADRRSVRDDFAFRFSGSAAGWRTDPESSVGITRIAPVSFQGASALELTLALQTGAADQSPSRNAGEAFALVDGAIEEVTAEVFAPARGDYSRQSPPYVQLFVKDTQYRSCYSRAHNIGTGPRVHYPICPGRWTTITFRPARRGEEPPGQWLQDGFDPDSGGIVGIKVALSSRARSGARLDDVIRIRNVIVRRKLPPLRRGRYLDLVAQHREISAWRERASNDAAATQVPRLLPPLGRSRPYFEVDPGWNAEAWTNEDIRIDPVSRRVLIDAEFRCDEKTPRDSPSRKGVVVLRFQPLLLLDPAWLDDTLISMDISCEPDPGAPSRTYPGPQDLLTKIGVFSQSVPRGEEGWRFSPVRYVGGPILRLQFDPKYRPGDPSGQSVLFVALDFYANRAWKGALSISNIRIGGLPVPRAALSGFVRPAPGGGRFALNGKPFAVRGANVSFLPQKSPYIVRHTLETIADSGFNTVRVWGFSDGRAQEGWVLQPAPGVFDEISFRRLDHFIAIAETHGLRVVLPLVNWWSDNDRRGETLGNYGGAGLYLQWAGVEPEYDVAGRLSNKHEFFTNAECRRLYKKYLRYVAGRTNVYTGRRYSDSPGLLAWELINEPRPAPPLPERKLQPEQRRRLLQAARPHAAAFARWADEMSTYLKETLHVRSMVAIGDEGFLANDADAVAPHRNGAYGIHWEDTLRLRHIDFGTVHVYPEHWGLSLEQSDRWLTDHIDIAAKAAKPILIEEWGIMDFTPRIGEQPTDAEERVAAVREAARDYAHRHLGDSEHAARDWAEMHPAMANRPADLAAVLSDKAPAENQARLDIYRRWLSLLQARDNCGWILWAVVGPSAEGKAVSVPGEADFFSLRLGSPPEERFLRTVGRSGSPADEGASPKRREDALSGE
jgi:mannan endo-1,4-beta-mannosidase